MYSPNSGSRSLTPSRFYLFWSQPPEAIFSDSGTQVLLASDLGLGSDFLHVIHRVDADPVTTRYFQSTPPYHHHKHLTPSGELLIEIEEVNRTSTRFVSRKVEGLSHFTRPDSDEISVYLDNFICYPSSLADSSRWLLLGQNDDEKMRLLIAPREGRALEIKSLPVTFNEVKRRLEIEWAKRPAPRNKGIKGAWDSIKALEENKERGT